MVVNGMESGLEKGKNKIKNEIKNFFDENKISYKEDENHIKIACEMFYVDFLKYAEISVKVGQDKYLTVTYDNGKLILAYEETFPNDIIKKLEISKDEIQAVYYYNNKLVFLF